MAAQPGHTAGVYGLAITVLREAVAATSVLDGWRQQLGGEDEERKRKGEEGDEEDDDEDEDAHFCMFQIGLTLQSDAPAQPQSGRRCGAAEKEFASAPC